MSYAVLARNYSLVVGSQRQQIARAAGSGHSPCAAPGDSRLRPASRPAGRPHVNDVTRHRSPRSIGSLLETWTDVEAQ